MKEVIPDVGFQATSENPADMRRVEGGVVPRPISTPTAPRNPTSRIKTFQSMRIEHEYLPFAY
jgi:hypothetical protein